MSTFLVPFLLSLSERGGGLEHLGLAWGVPLEFLVPLQRERGFFIDNLLVRIHLIIEMILVDRPCSHCRRAWGVRERLQKREIEIEREREVEGEGGRGGGRGRECLRLARAVRLEGLVPLHIQSSG